MQKNAVQRVRFVTQSVLILCASTLGCLSSSSEESPPLQGGGTTPDPAPRVPASTLSSTANKVDLLFAVDDSRSMADKHDLLRNVIPALFTRLMHPRCVRDDGTVVSDANTSGVCFSGHLEHPAVTDLHVGVVSSSLGTAGDICDVTAQQNRHAELYVPLGLAGDPALHESGRFLSWNAGSANDAGAHLADAFQRFFSRPGNSSSRADGGIGEEGCGVESQMESIYQFLMAPDPYNTLVQSGGTEPVRQGIRESILVQRRAFLRPDSMLMVVMLTDENDASIDPEVYGGGGARFSSFNCGGLRGLEGQGALRIAPYSGGRNPKGLSFPRATAACANLKNASAEERVLCTTCAVSPGAPGCEDPFLRLEDDGLNSRYARMTERYGVDPRFPVSRYVRGFRSPLLPSRAEEHSAMRVYMQSAGSCTNPVFAAALPGASTDELCHLEPGMRGPELVQFAILGGVPQDLVSVMGRPKDTLSDADWTRILGISPDTFDEDGIDPRMVELGRPRTAAALAALHIAANSKGIDELRAEQNAALAATDASYVVDDRNANLAGRESGFGADLNYACTIPIAPRAPTDAEVQGDGVCNKHFDDAACLPAARSESTTLRRQVRAKVYPTPRPLQLARAMGAQGISASLCPALLEGGSANDTDRVGYAPVVQQIASRIGARLLPN